MGDYAEQQNKTLWRRCRRTVAALPLPRPFDATAFTEALTEQRGRPLVLVPLPPHACTPCGMLVTTDRADYIGYPTSTSALHQQHILLHEVGHLVRGHAGVAHLDSSASRVLLPHLSGELVRRVLGRSVYSDVQEQEAELIASLALHRPTRKVRRPRDAWLAAADRTDVTEALARLGPIVGLAASTRIRATATVGPLRTLPAPGAGT
ncbi:ParH-like protein [Streptomyces sp. H10-C2]|uniref:ParH-like protein n=1 Tax=unclassified Streptomyces TaxID=2593676 RepID=UPI0024BB1706|nr:MULTISPECIES: ParH-like protein [unclassified Streptomyces]MDJ0340914.1 ParH-like protein [Streptomyces sp. PH10-H1]MDJ0369854.1 ParH-like protein [Streptomyces sp. H10-C2]